MEAGVVIVTYQPDMERLSQNISAIMKQCALGVIVDNGSDNADQIEALARETANLTVIRYSVNYGIAKALNTGMKYMRQKGFRWVLTLDQDTVCPKNMIRKMAEFTKYRQIGILCPAVWYHGWSKQPETTAGTVKVKACMTSGCLTRVSVWEMTGGYDESFFIDYVDNDFCEKVKAAGYQIVRVSSIQMYHELGKAGEKRICGFIFRYSLHAPWRYYYMIRNQLVFIHRYRTRLNVPKEYLKVIYLVLCAVCWEKKRWKVIHNLLRGIRDASGCCKNRKTIRD